MTSAFFNPAFFSHLYEMNGTTVTWRREPVDTSKHNSYIFFTRVDSNVTVTYEVSYDNSGTSYTTRWTKKGKQVDRKINMDNGVYRLVLSGTGIIAFTETENSKNFCNGNIYPSNYPTTPISLGETKSTPAGMPTLSSGSEFCIIFASANYTSTVTELDIPSGDSAEYTYGLQAGKLQKNQRFYDYGYNVYSALCIYFKTSAYFPRPKTFVLQVSGFLDIPTADLYPPPPGPSPTNNFSPSSQFTRSSLFTGSDSFTPSSSFIPSKKFTPSDKFTPSSSFSPSKSFNPTVQFTASLKFGVLPDPTKSNNIFRSTPTRSRKVHILTDISNNTETEMIHEGNVRAVVMKEPLSSSEVATVVTSASLSVVMIVITVVCFIMYMRSKAKQMKEQNFSAEDSDLVDSASFDYYSYSYSYYYPSYSSSSTPDVLKSDMFPHFYCDPNDLIPESVRSNCALQSPNGQMSLMNFIDMVPSLGNLSNVSTGSNRI